MLLKWALAIAVQLGLVGAAFAHELRPAFLSIREIGPEKYELTWKVPARGDKRLSLDVRLPQECQLVGEKTGLFREAAYLEKWQANCPGGLQGKEVVIAGLRTSLTDALAQVEFAAGETQSVRLTPEEPAFTLSTSQSRLEVARNYLLLGIEHILLGPDHLLFVLALMVLISDRLLLVKTITSFTVAHSLTLAASALGYWSLPQKPVEAAIALSIAFVASEIVKGGAAELRTAERLPWLVSFAFGLLHGFGFAGALAEIGLPQNQIPTALLFFNIGVELGQIAFVVGTLIILRIVGIFFPRSTASGVKIGVGYVVGTIAATWLIARLSSFV